MKKIIIFPLCMILLALTAGLYISCKAIQKISPEGNPLTASWIRVITGLTDSTNWPDSSTSWETFARNLNKAGFRVSWNHVENAAYYQIRILKERITLNNWGKAALVAVVQDTGTTEMHARIDRIQPSISGKKCTGCQACVSECPRHAITIHKGKAVIDPDSCTGCGMCYKVCTFNAVSNLNETNFYYFAVRVFSEDDVPSEEVTCTDYAYKSRYVNKNYRNQTIGLMWCGFCGAGCYILNPLVGEGVDVGACPVNAVYYDPNQDSNGNFNSIHIDQSKCISCGLCIEQCGYNRGNWSVRREVVSSEKLINLLP